MSFLHPEFLYYMLPPLFILFGLLLTQKESQEHFFSQEVMAKLRVSANTLTLRARNALMFLIGFLIILALAQPVINEGTITIKAKSADIMIALDISDSMLAEDVYPNRLKLAKQKALEFLKMAPNERIGVIAFAKYSYLVSPLSFDHSAVEFLLSQLDTDSITEKGTNFVSMLDVLNQSIHKEGKKYLLIFSDGGDSSDFSSQIQIAKQNNIVVFVLGMGTTKGAPIKLKDGSFIKVAGDIIVSKLNESIADLATQTGGVYIQNTLSNEDIKAMLHEIENIAEKKELKSEEIPRYIPLFYFPLGLALFILLLATSSMSKREKVHLPSAFLLFGLLLSFPDAKAGVLDFVDLKEAKEAYDTKEFTKASKLYENYANKTQNGESYFNAGNAFYKLGEYDKAIQSYEKATFDTKELRAKNFANMANAYVKTAKMPNLQKAVELYEKSLKLQEDKETRENLEAVKKFLEEQKSQEDKNKDKDKKDSDKQDKDQKDQEKKDSQDSEKQDQQNKDKQDQKDSQDSDKQDQQNKDQQEQDQKDSQNSDKQDQKDKDKQNKNQKDQDQKDSENSDKKDDKNQQKQDSQSKEKEKSLKDKEEVEKNKDKKDEKSQDQNKTAQQAKPDLKELEKDEKDKDASSSAMQNQQQMQMSNAEEEKWLGELNKQHSTYMYMLNDYKPKEDNTNEKPW